MITQEQQKQGAELLKTLAQKAWESSAFKEQLIENPISTIESVTGQKMQSDIKIIVEDQTDTSKIYLNIPRKIEIDELELTDEQLETVAGGTDLITGIALGVILVAGAYYAGKGSH
ncbi:MULTISPECIES: NHLP leader peptide family RiPP precursor [Arcicella]|uniref:NHLP leader peptide family RiPP n=1 Tax=Arcicella lustrica TaxID=2984196 RepID=A0ABU5SKW8_9BACT|nr:NHLP leader peptide family RiPP precursor [Arcicella sp. DC25W]MEA5427832.1 NHLP leader peptide family RiPP precursor [Arcicella sp. DC25W]